LEQPLCSTSFRTTSWLSWRYWYSWHMWSAGQGLCTHLSRLVLWWSHHFCHLVPLITIYFFGTVLSQDYSSSGKVWKLPGHLAGPHTCSSEGVLVLF
jgi:hypothetical protein